MRHPQFRCFFLTFLLTMMADNIEHVISYWVMFRKFRSPELAGFAVLSHWLPYLLLAIPIGGLADRVDPRKLIQIGMLLFLAVSAGWGFFFLTDSLKVWHAMLLLAVHGVAGVFWLTSSQLLLHAVVPADDLRSGVRLNASARYLGMLLGPAVGGMMLLGLGTAAGMFVNVALYLPMVLWLRRAPRPEPVARENAMRGFLDVRRTLGEVARRRDIASMVFLAASVSIFIGNSYHTQMPSFAEDLGHGNPGTAYSLLLGADAAGALVGVFVLELLAAGRTSARSALLFASGWCGALAAFALSPGYNAALISLFLAGFFEIAFATTALAVVQLEAPAAVRGRVLGLYTMASLGCRTFSGIWVGTMGSLLGSHLSLAFAALLLSGVIILLFVSTRRDPQAA